LIASLKLWRPDTNFFVFTGALQNMTGMMISFSCSCQQSTSRDVTCDPFSVRTLAIRFFCAQCEIAAARRFDTAGTPISAISRFAVPHLSVDGLGLKGGRAYCIGGALEVGKDTQWSAIERRWGVCPADLINVAHVTAP
jgi:hypothetical protein